MPITNCTRCGAIYEEHSEEEANSPARLCFKCFSRPTAPPEVTYQVRDEIARQSMTVEVGEPYSCPIDAHSLIPSGSTMQCIEWGRFTASSRFHLREEPIPY